MLILGISLIVIGIILFIISNYYNHLKRTGDIPIVTEEGGRYHLVCRNDGVDEWFDTKQDLSNYCFKQAKDLLNKLEEKHK